MTVDELVKKRTEIEKLYNVEFRSIDQIAEQYGVCRYTMSKVFSALAIPTRQGGANLLLNTEFLPEILRDELRTRQLVPKRLAQLAGVPYTTLLDNLKGKTPMSLDTALRVLTVLDMDNTQNVEFLKRIPTLNATLKDDINMTPKELARLADVPYTTLISNVKGETPTGLETALKILGVFFKTPTKPIKLLQAIQTHYEERKA